MNCDDAFDQMTAPGAQDHAALRQHLNRCPRCRAMQETLSPAIAWLTVGDAPDGDLPDGASPHAMFLTEDAVQVAERAAQRLGTRNAAAHRRGVSRRTVGAGLALAGMVAVFFCAIFLPSFDPPRGQAPAARFSTAESACLWTMPLTDPHRIAPTADQLIATCTACHLAAR